MPAVTAIESKPPYASTASFNIARTRSAVGDVTAQADGRSAIGDTCTGDSDADPVLVGDFLGGRGGGVFVQIDTNDMRAFLDDAMRDFLDRYRNRRR